MKSEEFRKYGKEIIDFIADYLESTEKYPVKPKTTPKEVFSKIPAAPPKAADHFENILKDFNDLILPNITHWQSPNFFAYFSSNNSYESILAELMSAGLGVNTFSWETSPAATELEEAMINWLRDLIKLPNNFTGVIQDTASVSTLCSILTAREQKLKSDTALNPKDVSRMRVYSSKEAHSSIERAVHITGIGRENHIKITCDDNFALNINELNLLIEKDIFNGFIPICVVSALGSTGSLAIDPIKDIHKIAEKYNLWHHIDAAYAGNALILEEYEYLAEQAAFCDTLVFNPHKWMFINFDFSAYFVKDKNALISTFEILPEYLKTMHTTVNNYRDWGIHLGRRFRALKAWFVLRGMGVDEIKNKLRSHIKLAADLFEEISANENFEIMAPLSFNLVCFRLRPKNINDDAALNEINEKLLNLLNSSGKIYLTKTKLNGKITLRIVTGTSRVNKHFVKAAWEFICKTADEMIK